MTDRSDSPPGDSEFEFLVGETTLVAFALDHTPADVLRELVQNEYDARGTSMELSFGVDRLTVRGNGRPIDAKGWKRLGVMLGTATFLAPAVTLKRSQTGSVPRISA